MLDADGVPQTVRKRQQLQFLNVMTYKTEELSERLEKAFSWAIRADDRARKALLYFEHACLLSEFAQTLPIVSVHASFSWGLAFLQYQSRAARLGLATDFWVKRVKELYTVRNDEDVAHYSLSVPEIGAMRNRFGQAGAAFTEAFAAYMATLPIPAGGSCR